MNFETGQYSLRGLVSLWIAAGIFIAVLLSPFALVVFLVRAALKYFGVI